MVFAFFLDFIWLFVKEFLYLHINSTRICALTLIQSNQPINHKDYENSEKPIIHGAAGSGSNDPCGM